MAEIETINGNPIVAEVASESIQPSVDAWLAAHPEATTTVQDNSITLSKLADDLSVWSGGNSFTGVGAYSYWQNASPQLSMAWFPLTISTDIDITSVTFTTTFSAAGTITAKVTDTAGTAITSEYAVSVESGRHEVSMQVDFKLGVGEHRLTFTPSSGVTMNYPTKYANIPYTDDGNISNEGTAYYYNNSSLVFVGTIGYAVKAFTDTALSAAGKAADSKAVGDRLADLDQTDVTVRNDTVYTIDHLRLAAGRDMTLVDGVYTFTAPSSGNTWADYNVYDADVPSGIGKLYINVRSLDDNTLWRVYHIFKTNGGTTKYTYFGDINHTGLYVYDLDLNYFSVYEDYDGNGMNLCVANLSAATYGKTIVIDRYDFIETVSDLENLPRSLNDVLNEFKADIDALSNQGSQEVVLRSYDGKGYAMQIDPQGGITAIPVIPSNILYVGNSLLLGFGNHGMASTTVSDDYYAKVNAYITSNGSAPTADRLSGTAFEGAETDAAVTSWLNGTLANYMGTSRQLVIIQLGDNVNTASRVSELARSAGMLCGYVRQHCPNARVVWVGEWYSTAEKQNIIQQACAKYGCRFIDISDLPNIEGNKNHVGATYIDADGNEQTITAAGVASHPSDQGFTQIAERIISALFE